MSVRGGVSIGRSRRRPAADLIQLVVRLAAAAALALDAYGHAADASFYAGNRGGSITQSTLFLLEAAVASLVALLLVLGAWLSPGRRTVWVLAFLVASSALGAVVLYTNVDVGVLGPIPDMYEPTWAVPDKKLTAFAEGAAVLLAAAGLVLSLGGRRHGESLPSVGEPPSHPIRVAQEGRSGPGPAGLREVQE